MSSKMMLILGGVITVSLIGVGLYFLIPSDDEEVKDEINKPSSEPETVTTINAEKPSEDIVNFLPNDEPDIRTEIEMKAPVNKEIKGSSLDEKKRCYTFVVVGEDDEYTFEDLNEALDALKVTKKARLKIVFEKSKFASLEEKVIRLWFARVGDYIFARRLVLFDDANELLRNPTFARAKGEDIEKIGNLLLSIIDEGTWAVTIGGLENLIDEIKIVADDIIIKALENPHLIMNPSSLPGSLISKRWQSESMLLINHQGQMADALLRCITWDESFKKFDVKCNLKAFLPLIDFTKASPISDEHLGNLNTWYKYFYRDFNQNIISKIGERDANEHNFKKILEETRSWLESYVGHWTKETDIAAIIKNTLFKE